MLASRASQPIRQNTVTFVLTSNQGDITHSIESRALDKQVTQIIPIPANLALWVKETLGILIPEASEITVTEPVVKNESSHTVLSIRDIMVRYKDQNYSVPGPIELSFARRSNHYHLTQVKTSNLVFCDLLSGEQNALSNLLIPDSDDDAGEESSCQVSSSVDRNDENTEKATHIDDEKISASSFIDFLQNETTKSSLNFNLTQKRDDISRYFNDLPDSTHFDRLTNSFKDAFEKGEDDLEQWFNFVIGQARYDLLTSDNTIRPEIKGLLNYNDALKNTNEQVVKRNLIAAYIEYVCELVTARHLKNCVRPLTEREYDVIRKQQEIKHPQQAEEYFDDLISYAKAENNSLLALCSAYFSTVSNALACNIGNGTQNYAAIEPNTLNIKSAELKFYIAAQALQNTLASLPDNDPRREKGKKVLNTIEELKQSNRLKALTRVLNNTTLLIKNPNQANVRAYRKKAEQLSSRGSWRTTLGVVMTGLAILSCFTPAVFLFGYGAFHFFQKPAKKKVMEPLTEKTKDLADETVNFLRVSQNS